MKKKIAWEFFTHPMMPGGLDAVQWPNEKFALPEIPDFLKDEEEGEEEAYHSLVKPKHFKILQTPVGILPIDDSIFSNKTFNVWILHTNFDLTTENVLALCKVPGVEAVKVFSRYRAIVVFARMFENAQVKVSIQQVLCGETEESWTHNLELDSATKKKVDEIVEKYKEFKHWFIYVLPNGKVAHVASNTKDESYDFQVDIYLITFEMVGGAIFTSEDRV